MLYVREYVRTESVAGRKFRDRFGAGGGDPQKNLTTKPGTQERTV